jgi:asparagine synthase (glutamine-hydrolysing)
MKRADVQEAIGESKKRLVEEGILDASVLTKSIQPHGSHAAENWDWKFWSTAFLYQNKL